MNERLIDTATIGEHRSLLDANLPDSCDIQTNANAGTDRAPDWVSADAPVDCAVSPFGEPVDTTRGDEQQSLAISHVRFRAGTAVTASNRLVVTSADGDGTHTRTLTVQGVRRGSFSTIATCRDATAAES